MSNADILEYSMRCVEDERKILFAKLTDNYIAEKNIRIELEKEKLNGQ